MRGFDLTRIEGIEAYVDSLYAETPAAPPSITAAAELLEADMCRALDKVEGVEGHRLYAVQHEPVCAEARATRGEYHDADCNGCDPSEEADRG